ncbi:MAG: tocopherol cyclase family protein [Bacteroidota bacterium]
MFSYLKNIYSRDKFLGAGRKDNYFEGWYFKCVGPETGDKIAIIPGIFISRDSGKAHSFIQYLDGAESRYFRYGIDEFKPHPDLFKIEIAGSFFSLNNIELNIESESCGIKGILEFTGIHPWPKSFIAPGAMGWYSYVPFMECNHGIISMKHDISGSLRINGEEKVFTGGKGYIEKDWGSRFPEAYVWAQCNHFDAAGISVMISIAKIPWLGSSFTGFICGIMIDRELYVMATYTGAKLDYLEIEDNTARFSLSDKKRTFRGEIIKSGGADLGSPYESDMLTRVNESMDSIIKTEFIDRSNAITIFNLEGNPASVEITGNRKEIITSI